MAVLHLASTQSSGAVVVRGQLRTTSGSMPFPLIFVRFGVSYRAVVTTTAEPSESSATFWMTALPKVRTPTSCARPLSCSAEERISEADAVFSSTSTVSGVAMSSPSPYVW